MLEVLLSLTIIFIILLMATRFYETAESSEKTNTAIRMLNSLTTAADDWFATYKTYQSTGGITLTKQALIDMGDLPQEFAGNNPANPWDGQVNITAKDSAHVTVELTKVPHADCLNLKGVMQKRMTVDDCPAAGGFKATYPGSP